MREGHTYTQRPVATLDHDFSSAGEGKLIPHGIYDLAHNRGYMNLHTSHDTSEFCCDSIAHEWKQYGTRLSRCPPVAAALRWGWQ